MSEIRYATKFWWQCRRHYKLRAVWFIKSVELIGGKVIRGQTSLCTHGTLSRGPTAGAIDIWQIATVVQSIRSTRMRSGSLRLLFGQMQMFR